MSSYIAIFLCLVTITLLSILLIRFKSLFSTEKILEKTKKYMDNMITDINKNTNTDIELINEASKRLRELIRDSEIQMRNYQEATDRLRNMIAEAEKSTTRVGINNVYQTNKNVSQIPVISKAGKSRIENAYKKIDPDSAFQINKSVQQKSLFDDDYEPKSVLKDETLITPEGTALKEVPLIITKVYDDERIMTKPEKTKKLNEQVQFFYDQGMTVQEIATELSCSITEVQLIIDMI